MVTDSERRIIPAGVLLGRDGAWGTILFSE